MREIKFRAWNKRTKEMNAAWLFQSMKFDADGKLKIVCPDAKNKEIILMQYTGLKDKNSKEIYEGDIIKSTLNETKIGIMEFKKGRFQISFKNRSMLFCHENRRSLEVLGNIYENSELLKGE